LAGRVRIESALMYIRPGMKPRSTSPIVTSYLSDKRVDHALLDPAERERELEREHEGHQAEQGEAGVARDLAGARPEVGEPDRHAQLPFWADPADAPSRTRRR